KIAFDLFVSLLPKVHEIHFVDRHDEMTNSQQVRNEGVPARLCHHAVSCIDENHRQIAVAGAGDKISRVLFVAWRVRDDEFSLCRRKVAICDVNGDALFALGLQAICQQRKIDAFAAAAFIFALRAFDLVLKCALCFDEQPPDESRFSVVDIAGGGEPKNITTQKYPSRFLSSMVLAPWSMILVEGCLIFAETVSSAISSGAVARDATAPVHGAQPSVRKRTHIFSGTSPFFRCIASSAGINVPLR